MKIDDERMDEATLRTEPAKQSLLFSVFAVDLSRSPKPILGAVLTLDQILETQNSAFDDKPSACPD